MTEPVTFKATSGEAASGVIALPEGSGKAPCVVLVQEYWGLNDHVRSLADRLAKAGFLVVAPDLYHGTVTANGEEAAKLMTELDGARAMSDIGGAAAFLLAHERSNGKVGVTGFCMGGAYTFVAATAIPEITAAVPFYGIPPAGRADYTKLHGPVMAHFAARDQWATVAGAQAIQKQIEAAGGSMELHVYDADHAFVNDARPEVYSADNARLAWDRTVAFLHKHLG